jgi:adenine-specific DNA-methyltransferase
MPSAPFEMARDFAENNTVTLATADCRKFLKTIPSDAAQLIMTSPPYNIGKAYEKRLSIETFTELLASVIGECVRIIKPGGSICFQVGNYMAGPNRPRPLSLLLDPLFAPYEGSDQLFLRNMLIWHFGHGLHAKRRFSGRYETVLWYTKGDDYIFNLDDVRVPQKYPGKRHFKGAHKGQPSGNPRGKNPGDVWDIPNVKANHVEKTKHPCQFPISLAKRLILALSNPGDLVVDPFAGVGTTAAAAVLTGRRAAGCDLRADYIATARERAHAAHHGTLPIRADRPVHLPSGRESVTQVPDGFWCNFQASAAERR